MKISKKADEFGDYYVKIREFSPLYGDYLFWICPKERRIWFGPVSEDFDLHFDDIKQLYEFIKKIGGEQ